MNFAKFLRAPFLQNTSRRRLLKGFMKVYLARIFSFFVVYTLMFLKEAWNDNAVYLYRIIGIEWFKFGFV